MKPRRRGCAGTPCGLGPLCTWINPETAIHSNTGNSPCSLSVVNLPSSRPTDFWVKARELRMNPRQVENRSNLANRVIVRNYFIKTK
jgi:hypothetical protein